MKRETMKHIDGSIIKKGLPLHLHARAAKYCRKIIDEVPSQLFKDADMLVRISERLAIAQIKFEDAMQKIEQRMND
jgi:hypothetical protein